MRRLWVPLILIGALVGNCRATVGPATLPSAAPPAAATPPALSETPAGLAAMPAGGITASAPAPTAETAAVSTAAPSGQPPTEGASPWPAFLRALDLGVPAGNSYYPRAVAVDPELGRLYVRTHAQGTDTTGKVTVLDLSSGRVLAVAATGADPYSEGELLVDATRSRVYATNPPDESTSVLDAKSLAPVATLQGVEHLALDEAAGRLYAAGTGSVRCLDAAAYDTLVEVDLPAEARAAALAVDPAAGRLYLVLRYPDRATLAVLDASGLAERARATLPGVPNALLADPARGQVYLSANDGTDDLLQIRDSEGALVEELGLGDYTQRTALALAPEGRLFLGKDAYGKNGVAVLDLETEQLAGEIPLRNAPSALAWDESRGKLWVSHTYDNAVSVVDLQTGQVLAHYPTALGITDLQLDPERGHLYVADTEGQIHVLDQDSDRELANLPGGTRIAVDGPHGRFFGGGEQADSVRIFDSDRLELSGTIDRAGVPVADAHSGGLYIVDNGIYLTNLETLTVTGVISDSLPPTPEYAPYAGAIDAVVDPGSGRIFAIISNGVPGSNAGTFLYVYEPITFQKVLTDTERSPSYVDVDPASGLAYISRIHMDRASTRVLAEGRRYTASVESLFGAVRVSPSEGKVYVSAEGELLRLDAATLDVEGAVPIPGGLQLRALDPRRHWLYLAADDGRVQVWSTSGGKGPPAHDPIPADLAQAGPLRLFLAPDGNMLFASDGGRRLYRSADAEDRVWGQVVGGLPDGLTEAVAFSPGFDQDETVYAGLSSGTLGLGVWRSGDGGQSWRIASHGLTDLSISEVVVSPAFARDRTLFAATWRSGVYRSTDEGQHWVSLSGGYRPAGASDEPVKQLLLSPDYGRDRTLFIEHYGLWRSEDGGDSWQALEIGTEGYGEHYLFLSPDYGASRAVYDLWISTDSEAGSVLAGSTDGGITWEKSGEVPAVETYGAGRIIPAAGGLVYFVWTPYDPVGTRQLFRSSDIRPVGDKPATLKWDEMIGGAWLAEGSGQPVTPIELAEDGTALVALDKEGKLLRWRVSDLSWSPVTAQAPVPGPTAIP